MRWQHPERGLLEPAQFIFVAEATDLIVGHRRLRAAGRHATRLRAGASELGTESDFTVSVNLSERRLADRRCQQDRPGDLRRELPASCLCLEVAERAMMDRRGDALARSPTWRALGVRLLDRRLRRRDLVLRSDQAPASPERDQDRLLVHRRAWGARARTPPASPRSSGSPTGCKLTATAEGVETRRAAGASCERSDATGPRATTSHGRRRRQRSGSCLSRPATESCWPESAPARGPCTRCGRRRSGSSRARSGSEVAPARVALGQGLGGLEVALAPVGAARRRRP